MSGWLAWKKKLALSSGVFDSSISSVLEVCQSRDGRDDPVFHYKFGGGLPALGRFSGMLCSLEGKKSDLKLHYTAALPKTGVEEKNHRRCYSSPPLAYWEHPVVSAGGQTRASVCCLFPDTRHSRLENKRWHQFWIEAGRGNHLWPLNPLNIL